MKMATLLFAIKWTNPIYILIKIQTKTIKQIQFHHLTLFWCCSFLEHVSLLLFGDPIRSTLLTFISWQLLHCILCNYFQISVQSVCVCVWVFFQMQFYSILQHFCSRTINKINESFRLSKQVVLFFKSLVFQQTNRKSSFIR